MRMRLAKRIFCHRKSAPAVKARNTRVEAISQTASSRVNGRMLAGDMAAMFSSSRRWGFSTNQQTAITATSLTKVLTKFIRPSGPKMRFTPSSGLILLHLGFIFSALKIRPDWARLPPTPPRITASAKAPRKGAAAHRARAPISTPAPASSAPTMV